MNDNGKFMKIVNDLQIGSESDKNKKSKSIKEKRVDRMKDRGWVVDGKFLRKGNVKIEITNDQILIY